MDTPIRLIFALGGALMLSSCQTLESGYEALNDGFTSVAQGLTAGPESEVASDTAEDSYPFFIGEVVAFAFDFCPSGFIPANGQPVTINNYGQLYNVIGEAYGSAPPQTFRVPDMRGRLPFGASDAYPRGYHGAAQVQLEETHLPRHGHALRAASFVPTTPSPEGALIATFGGGSIYAEDAQTMVGMNAAAIGNSGGSIPLPLIHPYATATYCIATDGMFPQHPGNSPPYLEYRYIGDLFFTAGEFCPDGSLPADGRVVSEGSDYFFHELFSLVGSIYGGDNRNTVGFPDLSGRSPVGAGTPPTPRQSFPIGLQAGAATADISMQEMPVHSHALIATDQPPASNQPADRFLPDLTALSRNAYFKPPSQDAASTTHVHAGEGETGVETYDLFEMGGESIAQTGGGASFDRLGPMTALNACLVLHAPYPTRP